MRARKGTELPDDPIDEDEQDAVIEQFKTNQERAEKFFSTLLILVLVALFAFFIMHAYLHVLSPWPSPFEGLREADKLGRNLAGSGHTLTAISILFNAVSIISNDKMRSMRRSLLNIAALAAILSLVIWIRVLSSLPTFSRPYLFFFTSILLGPFLIQACFMHVCLETRKEISKLHGYKYRCRNA
ncbi:hypothetical protein GUITHDRAFT_152961 [Guillardia theta CCMP2712]|uniref:Uncharacterized protein n=1 Tax=Guillardia theta (strain CCMP2712) TaxID=905079 RepID=L1J7D6_GUITC|nr:hypothetical protein GUITHDRAFT_152961 [Guillardia theta CCMP2712]EKX44431.1 hypothetical protein GUITHDRAFT_152961 [Guillardia theta CCMP2712]|eukprot:XP_005831411.1 hypothetical protein GUITHDRAFT_152961 [Guillardia theta CCMP2712]